MGTVLGTNASYNLRVLVVHRQEGFGQRIKSQLENSGWHSRLAVTGLDGLLAARRESFDVILCSADLPIITGVEMVRALRNFSNNISSLVIFIHSFTEDYNRILSKLRAFSAEVHEENISCISEIIEDMRRKQSEEIRLTYQVTP